MSVKADRCGLACGRRQREGGMALIRKKALLVVILLEAVFILAGVLHYGKKRDDLHYESSDLFLVRSDIPEEPGFYVDGSYDGKERRISTPAFHLDKGIYSATVDSHIEKEELFVPYSRVVEVPDGKTLSFSLSDRIEEQYYVLCDKTPLRNYQPVISYRFHVRADNAPLALICYIDNEKFEPSDTWLLVNNVEIRYLREASVLRFLIIWLFLFICADCLFCWYKNRETFAKRFSRYRFVFLSLLVIFIFSEIPMLLPFNPHGGDIHFHMTRLSGLAQGLSDGVFPVKIQPIWNNGYGDAAGTMYGDLLLYIPALLYNSGFTIDFAYKFYVFLINLLTVVFSYLAAKSMFRDKKIALLSCAFYTLSPYRMLDVYGRAAVGEYTAMAFLPLVVLGMYLIYRKAEPERCSGEEKYGWLILAVGFFGVVTSHALSIIMVGFFMLLFALIEFKKTFSKELFPEFLKAAFFSGALGLYFLLPFTDYYINVPMRVNDYLPGTGIYSENIASLPQIFELPLEKEPFGAGPLCGLVILAAIYLYLKQKGKRNRQVGITVILCIVLIWMSSNFFPYAAANHFFYIPYSAVLEQLQFPWRWVSILTVLCYALFGWELAQLKDSGYKNTVVLNLYILFAIIITTQSYIYTDTLYREIDDYDYINVSATNAWGWDFEVAREYAPRHITMDSVHPLEIEHADTVEIRDEKRQSLKFWLSADNPSDQDETLVFPVFAYKGYRAVLADGTEIPIEAGHDFRIQLTIPAHTAWNGLHLYFAETPLWRLSELISALSIAALIVWSAVHLISYVRKQEIKHDGVNASDR